VDVNTLGMTGDRWRLKAHYARFASWVAVETARWKPDWVYASDFLVTPVAALVARQAGARVVYHEHDAPSEAHESWAVSRCLAARRWLASRADVVVVPNAQRAAALSRDVAGGRPVVTVWNCPRRPDPTPPTPSSTSTLRLVYRGTINCERLPTAIVEAIGQLDRDVTLDIVGYETEGSRGYVAHFLGAAERAGVGRRVRAHGPIAEAAVAEVCPAPAIGLAFMPVAPRDANMRWMIGASNKVFEYLAQGAVPLVTDLPDWRATFVEPGYALASDPSDVVALARALAWAGDHRGELRDIAARGYWRLREDWNYETQFAPVLRQMLDVRTRVDVGRGSEPAEVTCAS
jgi:glycosyltransferase involved in cell wall biosynthesis